MKTSMFMVAIATLVAGDGAVKGMTRGATSAVLSDWIYLDGVQEIPRKRDPPHVQSSALEAFARTKLLDTELVNVELERIWFARSTDQQSDSGIQFALVRQEKVRYVVFRGTADHTDWIVNLHVTPNEMRSKGKLWVHAGVLAELENVESNVLKILTDNLSNKDVVVLCGHSLGGTYATIAAAHLLDHDYLVNNVLGFGSPQVVWKGQGGHHLWGRLNSRLKTYVYQCDLVPRLLGPSAEWWIFNLTASHAAKTAKMAINEQAGFAQYLNPVGAIETVARSSLGLIAAKSFEYLESQRKRVFGYHQIGSVVYCPSHSQSSKQHCSKVGQDQDLRPMVADHSTANYIAHLRNGELNGLLEIKAAVPKLELLTGWQGLTGQTSLKADYKDSHLERVKLGSSGQVLELDLSGLEIGPAAAASAANAIKVSN
jgi:pimeloyl-ACP methyl ester carboxylesterase